MTPSLRRLLLCGLLAAGAPGAGCRGEGDSEPGSDAADPGALDGLTREQIEERAEPMSPERARELGIVDTVIHLENLGDSDTIRLPPDTAR